MSESAEKRFWRHVHKTDSCWNWTAYIDGSGYGRMTNVPERRAHRFSYALVHGAIPDGMLVLHKCDNPRCVNPDHLFLGTHLDNSRDMIAKGRGSDRRGSLNATSKLSENDVIEIRNQIASGLTHVVIAKQFGVCKQTIGKIYRKERWAHVA